jgi:hypothetical protein
MATTRSQRLSISPRLAFLAALILGLAHGDTAAAQASNTCGPRAEVVKHLASQFKEQAAAVGIAENGSAVLEILASADGSTWTLLYSLPNGLSCLMATGQSWQTLPKLAASGPGA